MITRIEIDGFKSFENFALDLPPFLVLIGTNASGKSNLLDALTFVATAGTRGVDAAVSEVRGDARGLFRKRGDGSRVDRMRFALELLLPARGSSLSSRWRWEVCFAWAVPEGELEGITIETQRLVSLSSPGRVIPSMEHEWVVSGRRSALQYFPSSPKADWQVVSDIEHELAQVRSLHLEAGSLRGASELGGPRRMDSTGRNLPNYLRFLARETASENRPLGVVGEIKMHLVGLVREISDFEIVEDKRRRDVRLEFASPYDRGLDAEFASDGTLRMLAILAALHDDGTAVIEEPENGVFPERLRQLLGLARELVTGEDEAVTSGPGRPLQRQALFTSHSPVVLDAVPRENIAFLDMTTILEGAVASRVSRVRRLREDDGAVRGDGERWPRVTDSELDRFRAGVEEPV
ncbi:AAA family ATPase [Microbispora hainanensis]|uniref:AAA family ATPase n=1 Tax=Microbispora hainanensis TaxID=568844 RepID=A0A544YVX9_9ACTN|nr:ATP-binding protein [Microbispora hainanensis]TQS20921.1 AAA family ATPase [Microbispora hainanensis]